MTTLGVMELLIIVILAAIFVRSRRVGLVILVLLLALGAFVSLFHVRRSHFTRGALVHLLAESGSIQVPPDPGDIWKPGGIADQRRADVYVSEEDAARGLGSELRELIGQLCPAGGPSAIQIYGQADENLLKRQVLHTLADSLERAYCGTVRILVESTIPGATLRNVDSEAVTVKVAIRRIRMQLCEGQLQESQGDLIVELAGPRGRLSHSAPYHYLLWLDDFEGYCHRHRGRSWAQARSTTACSSRQEAIDQALAVLAAELAARHPRLGDVQLVTDRIRRWGAIEQEFVQRIDGEAGPIWRAAVLIGDMPVPVPEPAVLDDAERVVEGGGSNRVRSNWTAWLVLPLLVLLIGAGLKVCTRDRKDS